MTFNSKVTDLPGVGPELCKKLNKLGIETIFDLLHHIPSRYSDFSQKTKISDLKIGENVTVEGQITQIKNIFTKNGKVMQEAIISDGESTMPVVWFRQIYLLKTLPPGSFVALTGKVGFWGKKRAIMSPQYEKITDNSDRLHSGRIVSIYHETEGVTSKWLRRLVHLALKEIESTEFLPNNILETINLKKIDESLKKVHQPTDLNESEQGRIRLAFNELLGLELAQRERRSAWLSKNVSLKLSVPTTALFEFLDKLPFTPTKSQTRSMGEIASELSREIPMNRLLEGDVGSGKTLVAAFASFVASKSNASSLIMAPTQILAQQHFETLTKLLSPHNIPVSLITAKEKVKSIKKLGVYVGTQALLFKYINSDIGLVVIDEQHRFGVSQRAKLSESGKAVPHVLTMTATPIPRTIALTLYGDLELSTLDELPKGRKPITTWVVPPKKRDAAYEWIDKKIEETKSQVFVVCPLIEESESEKMKEIKAATSEYKKLVKIFPKRKVALLHGRMKIAEKTKILDDFKNKIYDILVTTPVVEVGIDVPNATIMVIEAADRFGLAALHQLRGRVGRGEKESFCLLLTENLSEKVKTRLTAMSKTMSGHELAELDLSLRGPGEIFGTKQSGVPELKIARWTDVELIKRVKDVANEISNDPNKYQDVFLYYHSLQKAPN